MEQKNAYKKCDMKRIVGRDEHERKMRRESGSFSCWYMR